jgi:hypothetical protein
MTFTPRAFRQHVHAGIQHSCVSCAISYQLVHVHVYITKYCVHTLESIIVVSLFAYYITMAVIYVTNGVCILHVISLTKC